jgi:raffinose/stachyose/melibiose transport system substrate-binding protein
MKFNKKTGARVAATAVAAALAMGSLAGCAPAGSNTFTVWWYEKGTAMASTWADALKELQKNHPDVKIKFELKTWDQIQKAGNAILDSNKAPDLAEWNKGNATAGTASQAGLLTDLAPYADKYGWTKSLPSSALVYGQYEKGLMGSGNLYGIPSYGEYVSWFYNKDTFDKYGLTVPKTPAELDTLLAALKSHGLIQGFGGGDYQNVHMAYALAVSQADQQWVKNFQHFDGAVDWTKWEYAANKIAEWKSKGYFEKNASGIKADAANAAFEAGKYPLILAGTWLDQDVATKAKFNWGKFQNPGNLSVGSAGNLLVIPTRSKNKDLAAEFINLVLSTKYQNELGNAGGLPLLADQAALTNPVTVKSYSVFDAIVKADGLAMYPDWPVAGYYDIQLAAGTKLVGDGNAAAYVKTIKDFYDKNKPAA